MENATQGTTSLNQGEEVGNVPQQTAQEVQQEGKIGKNKVLLAVGVILGFAVFGVGGYYLGLNARQTDDSTGTASIAQPTLAPTATPSQSTLSGWNTYTNSNQGFKIQYPNKVASTRFTEEWVYEEYDTSSTDFSVGFGTPPSKPGGYIWGINVYQNANLEDLIKQAGSQFDDREESRENITVDRTPALLVTVTTNQYADWISKVVYIQKGNKIYAIGNGAIDMAEFDSFFNSFEFIQ